MTGTFHSKKVGFLLALLSAAGVSVRAGVYFYHKKHCADPVTVYAWRMPSGPIFIAEDPLNPKLQEYRRSEHLDRIVEPHKTDFKKVLALAEWASRQFVASTPFPHYPPWDAQVILHRIRRGQTGGYC